MIRIGVDFGGTKIEAAALDPDGRFVARVRGPTPPAYEDRLEATREIVAEAERQAGVWAARIGVGGPGSPSPATGLMRNSNSTVLNDRPFPADLERVLERPVRYANDANCLALSEATDGAATGARAVFAVIIGTGCGGGIAVDGRLVEGRNLIAGEWGHTPLPWPRDAELPGVRCWCGRVNCLELWLSGTGFAREAGRSAEGAVAAADHAALDLYADRLARGLAVIVDILDPDVIVLGGGMSNIARLYETLPAAITPHVFSDVFETPIRPALHGDSSGVRGAAWLWPLE
ncbi:ROK family protein [Phenylobacterium kunshanense]|uniref:Transcriptional regulator n=1 Tax=Phenylobacterium kunshanense TaxID=1445034 RepID=A0A328BVS3_9CAUL|nr:ROK family protein [Phenylobacterium kunshanense]RAK69168.1 transcriptional regulator [Phenylobacterium kunshanense]